MNSYPLVDYESDSAVSDDELSESCEIKNVSLPTCPPLTLKRKSATLPSTRLCVKKSKLKIPFPSELLARTERVEDVDELGRVRRFAHVRGNWATHVYFEVPVEDDLVDFIDDTIDGLQSIPTLAGKVIHPFVSEDNQKLHISLSQTVTLQYHEIGPFFRTLAEALKLVKPFSISLKGLRHFVNESQHRSFLALCVSQGHAYVQDHVLTRVDDAMRQYKQPVYYENPSLHASFCWWIEEGTELEHSRTSRDHDIDKQQKLGVDFVDEDERVGSQANRYSNDSNDDINDVCYKEQTIVDLLRSSTINAAYAPSIDLVETNLQFTGFSLREAEIGTRRTIIFFVTISDVHKRRVCERNFGISSSIVVVQMYVRNDKPLLATETLDDLLYLGDDVKFLIETVNEFVEQMTEGLVELGVFWHKQQYVDFSKKAHFLKGSCLALGCERVAFILEKMEISDPSEEDKTFCTEGITSTIKAWESTLILLQEYSSARHASKEKVEMES
eukprot:CFRG3848T1